MAFQAASDHACGHDGASADSYRLTIVNWTKQSIGYLATMLRSVLAT